MKENKCEQKPKAEQPEAKKRCDGGVVKNNMPDGRKAKVDSCKDAE